MTKPATAPRSLPPPVNRFDGDRAERAVRELLLALGEDPDRDGLRDTPRRVAEMYRNLFAGRGEDPGRHLSRTFAESFDELVVVRDIAFASTCEHHLLPFIGHAHIAYLPGARVVGLSKLARMVDGFAARPQVQERLTRQVADALVEHLDPRAALVAVRAEHSCMAVRGVRKVGATTWTMAARGAFRDDPSARCEALSLIRDL